MFKEAGTLNLEARTTLWQAANTRSLNSNPGGAFQATLRTFYKTDHERNLMQSVRKAKLDICAWKLSRQLRDNCTRMTMNEISYNLVGSPNSKSEPQLGGMPSRQLGNRFTRTAMNES